jgi:hypothetical protein
MNVKYFARIITLWMASISVAVFAISYNQVSDNKFYRFGPHTDFIILGLRIDTPIKYAGVVCFSFINAIFRTLQNDILHSWVINKIQDVSCVKTLEIKKHAYEINTINIIYQWWDWLAYMSILLQQIDMVLVEIASHLITSTYTTHLYLKAIPPFDEKPLLSGSIAI